MIKQFSVLYVGHVELENPGLGGTPADERFYTNDRIAEAYDMIGDVAKLADELGFGTLWLAEHHFQREGYEVVPNLILLGTYLASQTQRIKIGCSFNIVPMWHPLRLAEDYAMADILTKGRLIFGVGRGYHSREVETLGGPLLDAPKNLEYFEEQIEIILKAFNNERFSHHGKYFDIPPKIPYRGYELEDVTLVPRPVHLPVEIWQPISSGRTLEYIARKGFKGMLAFTGEGLVDRLFRHYQDAAGKAGRQLQLGEDLAVVFGFYVAPSRSEAIERLRPYHDERFKWFAPFGLVRYMDAEGRMWGTQGAPSRVPTLEESLEQRAWLPGTPQDIVDYFKSLEQKYPGMEQVILHWPEGMGKGEFKEQLRLVARDVMPAFGIGTLKAGAAAGRGR